MSMDWEIIGHEWAVETLKKHVHPETVRHAFLFCGPQGVGRRTLALSYARALNCLEEDISKRPCGTCRICRQTKEMTHPDLIVVQPEQPGVQIKIEQVRELQHTLSLAPYEARYRVALLLHFDEASLNAMNSMLKTLEEPAPQVVIILTAENPELLLPTIVSRCEVLQLRALSVAQTGSGMRKLWGLPEEQASLFAHISGGRPGYARSLFSDAEAYARRRAVLDDLTWLLAANRVERFGFIEPFTKDNKRWREVYAPLWRERLQIWLSFWRDVLVTATGARVAIFNLDQEQFIRNLAEQLGVSHAQKILSAHERTINLLALYCNPRLTLEVLMLELPFTRS